MFDDMIVPAFYNPGELDFLEMSLDNIRKNSDVQHEVEKAEELNNNKDIANVFIGGSN